MIKKKLVGSSQFQYDRAKQAKVRQHPPYWTKDPSKYSRSQEIFECNNCGDTAFELLENGKKTGKCCRCGEKF